MNVPARRLSLALLVVAVAVAGAWKLLGTREKRPSDRLSGNGTIEATEVDVSAKIAGKVVELHAGEGDAVQAGQLVARLDSEELQGQVDQAEAALRAAEAGLAELRAGTRSEEITRARAQYQAAAQAREQAQASLDLLRAGARKEQLEQLRAQVRQAQAALALAEADLDRAQALFEQGGVPAQQVDHARTARDTARAQVQAAQERLAEAEAGARTEEIRAAEAALRQARDQERAAKAALDLAVAGPRQETIAAARARVEQAQGALRAARAQEGYTRVVAPVGGTVVLRNVELGELVTPGLPIVRIAVLDKVWLRVYVPEREVGRVRFGQQAEVTCDSFASRKYPGKVIEIAQEAEFTPKNVQTKEERVKLVFGVKVEVENAARDLKPGMPADAVIFVGRGRAQPGR